jgi:hypothetical protein
VVRGQAQAIGRCMHGTTTIVRCKWGLWLSSRVAEVTVGVIAGDLATGPTSSQPLLQDNVRAECLAKCTQIWSWTCSRAPLCKCYSLFTCLPHIKNGIMETFISHWDIFFLYIKWSWQARIHGFKVCVCVCVCVYKYMWWLAPHHFFLTTPVIFLTLFKIWRQNPKESLRAYLYLKFTPKSYWFFLFVSFCSTNPK